MKGWWIAGGLVLLGAAAAWVLHEGDEPRAESSTSAVENGELAATDAPADVAARRAEVESVVAPEVEDPPSAGDGIVVRGVVIDPDERPIPDVEVRLLGSGASAVEAHTADDGTFVIAYDADGEDD